MTQQVHRIVVAFDFSELSQRAIHQALDLANNDHTEVHVLSVGAVQGDLLKLPEREPMTQADASETVRAAVATVVDGYTASRGNLALDKIAVYASEGHPSEQIVALAEELDADLIVMGTHSRMGLSRVMLGSVAEAVTRRAPCGVFVIRPRDFLKGQPLPDIDPPLKPGEKGMRHFKPRALYHYVDRMSQEPSRIVPLA